MLCPEYNNAPVSSSNLGVKRPPPTDEARANMSAAQKGRKHSEETLDKMSKAQRGRKCKPFSEEHLANLSVAQLGRKHSKESKDKRSVALKGRKFSKEWRAKLRVARRKSCRLTLDQIHEIRHLLALGDMLQREIAEYFPVGSRSISEINVGHTYADW